MLLMLSYSSVFRSLEYIPYLLSLVVTHLAVVTLYSLALLPVHAALLSCSYESVFFCKQC